MTPRINIALIDIVIYLFFNSYFVCKQHVSITRLIGITSDLNNKKVRRQSRQDNKEIAIYLIFSCSDVPSQPPKP